MTAENPPTMLDLVGLWECGECGRIDDVTHFYEDRVTGEMRHCFDPDERKRRADQCGWRGRYGDYGPPIRCALNHGHRGNHNPNCHGYGAFTESDAIPPFRRTDGASTP